MLCKGLLDGKPKCTLVSNYTMKTLSQSYGLDKLMKRMFNLSFKTIYHYQYKYPGIRTKLLFGMS